MTRFDTRFRDLLRDVVRQVRRTRIRPEDGERARRRRLSSSGTFTGHRAYSQGEDLRGLDWNVYARSGDLFVKVLEEEQRRSLNVLLDVSQSMSAGTPPRLDGALRIAALLGGVALARLDGLNVVTGDHVASLSSGASMDALLDQLDAVDVERGDSVRPVETWAAQALRGRVVWISDFADVDELAHGLRLLGRARRETFGLLPTIAEDELPEVDGYIAVRDPESEESFRVRVDASLRAAIESELRALRRRQDAVFRQSAVPLVRQRVPAPSDFRVRSWTEGGWPWWI